MSPQKQRRTFISYSRINKEFALKLALELKSAGLDIWLDQLDIPIGEQWDDAIEKALEDCEIFMVILTPASSMSDNVKDEIGYAIDSGKRILPILLENAKVPLRLRRLQYVDFTTKSYEEGVESAKQLIKRLIEEPTVPRDQLAGMAEVPTVEGDQPGIEKESKQVSAASPWQEPQRATTKEQERQAPKPVTPTVPPKTATVSAPAVQKSRMPLILGAAGAGVLVIGAFVVFALMNGPGGEVPTTGGAENTGASPVPVVLEVEPTDTLAPEPTAEAAQPTNTLEPTAVPDSPAPQNQKFFTEEFDGDLSAWYGFLVDRRRDPKQPVIVKEQSVQENPDEYKDINTSAQDSLYLFNIPRRQTTLYSFFDGFNYDDVRVDVRVDSRNINANYVTLICRYSETDGWYEFRIAHNGLYGIYYAKPNATGLITFRTIADGGSDKVKSGNAVNEFGIVCQGSELTLYINGELIKKDKDLLGVLRTGRVGVAVSSLDGLPVSVGFDWVKFSEPE
jgi:hypothetical protein